MGSLLSEMRWVSIRQGAGCSAIGVFRMHGLWEEKEKQEKDNAPPEARGKETLRAQRMRREEKGEEGR